MTSPELGTSPTISGNSESTVTYLNSSGHKKWRRTIRLHGPRKLRYPVRTSIPKSRSIRFPPPR